MHDGADVLAVLIVLALDQPVPLQCLRRVGGRLAFRQIDYPPVGVRKPFNREQVIVWRAGFSNWCGPTEAAAVGNLTRLPFGVFCDENATLTYKLLMGVLYKECQVHAGSGGRSDFFQYSPRSFALFCANGASEAKKPLPTQVHTRAIPGKSEDITASHPIHSLDAVMIATARISIIVVWPPPKIGAHERSLARKSAVPRRRPAGHCLECGVPMRPRAERKSLGGVRSSQASDQRQHGYTKREPAHR